MIKVRAKPNSSENSIHFDSENDIYIVKVKAVPDKNKANDAIIKLLSKHFGKKCKIKSGLTSKDKLIEFIEQ
ncbi:DUF167 domain-containing protein [Candidatus Woesearchaeota archaeon]|nr:DUF167 domain-containing protein [Candidatus Woesearchaeota archaeon]